MHTGAPDGTQEESILRFGKSGLAALIMALVAITSISRITIATRLMPV